MDSDPRLVVFFIILSTNPKMLQMMNILVSVHASFMQDCTKYLCEAEAACLCRLLSLSAIRSGKLSSQRCANETDKPT